MQIIQTIRDKGSIIVIGVIALSLIGFILMDSKQGGGSMFSSSTTNVGKVNGETIEVNDFNYRVGQAQAAEERNGQRVSSSRTNELREQMWNQIVAEKIFYGEADKLGIELTAKELSTILLSNDPANPFMQEQSLLGPDGQLDMAKAQKAVSEDIKKAKGTQREVVDNQIINPLKLSTAVAKYGALLAASAYYPAWMQQKDSNEENQFANISYVTIPFSEISDSSITVTDAEINNYVKKNADLFKQEAGRMISYVAFSQLPNREDSNKARMQVEDLKNSFAVDTNARVFVARNASTIEFEDKFKSKAKYSVSGIDSLVAIPQGTVYGPFVDGKNYTLAKVLGTKQLPDSVKARHILIATNDPQTQQQKMPDSLAKKLADSVFAAIKSGADFGSLALKYSDDGGSKIKAGDLGTFSAGTMVPEFDEYVLNQPVGSKGIVKTVFGYHIIEVLSHKDLKPAYKIAFVAKEIVAGDATINAASLQATKASAEKDGKSLASFAAKNGYSITQVPTIVKENDFSAGSLQDARTLIRWAFDAKKGSVSEVFSIGDNFVVATVDKVFKEGVQDAETARSGSEVIIKKEKKADIIIKKLGNNPTLAAAAAAYNKQVISVGEDSSITMVSQIINGLGVEPKVIGASFNKSYQSAPSPAFAGTNGVYVLKVNAIQAKPSVATEMAAQKQSAKISAMRNQTNSWYEGLKKLADIKDKRSTHF
ncbi:MAG: peptidylprolyl isomerase [Ferruginibacter sp.]